MWSTHLLYHYKLRCVWFWPCLVHQAAHHLYILCVVIVVLRFYFCLHKKGKCIRSTVLAMSAGGASETDVPLWLTDSRHQRAGSWLTERAAIISRQAELIGMIGPAIMLLQVCSSTTVIDNFIHTCSTKHAAYIYPQTNMQYNDIIGYLMPNAELINLVHHHLILMWRCMDHLCPSMGEMQRNTW